MSPLSFEYAVVKELNILLLIILWLEASLHMNITHDLIELVNHEWIVSKLSFQFWILIDDLCYLGDELIKSTSVIIHDLTS